MSHNVNCCMLLIKQLGMVFLNGIFLTLLFANPGSDTVIFLNVKKSWKNLIWL